MPLTSSSLEPLRFDDDGLIPAIVQQAGTGEILTLAYMTRASLARTLELGETVFWSRSRGELWHKGETSGHVQPVRRIRYDCDGDALLVEVDIGPDGVACHTGERSCFHHDLVPGREEAG